MSNVWAYKLANEWMLSIQSLLESSVLLLPLPNEKWDVVICGFCRILFRMFFILRTWCNNTKSLQACNCILSLYIESYRSTRTVGSSSVVRKGWPAHGLRDSFPHQPKFCPSSPGKFGSSPLPVVSLSAEPLRTAISRDVTFSSTLGRLGMVG